MCRFLSGSLAWRRNGTFLAVRFDSHASGLKPRFASITPRRAIYAVVEFLWMHLAHVHGARAKGGRDRGHIEGLIAKL